MKNQTSPQNRLKAFCHNVIGPFDTRQSPSAKTRAIKFAKLLLLSWRGFFADLCPLRASALTLYSLLSIVPVFAMLFGIAKGFGLERLLQERLLEQFRDQHDVTVLIIGFAQTLLAKTQGDVIAGIGIVLLFWSVMSVIGEIETSFNHIWKIATSRTFSRKISDYMSLMLLAPMLLIVSGSIAVIMQSHIGGFMAAMHAPEYGTQLLLAALGYLPLLIVWLVFSVTFIFMPNTKVEFTSGILAGVLTGTAYQLVQWAYLRLQIGVSSYNAIYGSLAALPLFIVWLQIGWLILLFGAELAFYHQHFESYRNKDVSMSPNFAFIKIAALRIAHLLVHRFAAAEPPLTAEQITQILHLPLLTVQEIVAELHKAHILAAVQSAPDGTPAYQPARDIALLRIATVIEALENNGGKTLMESGAHDCFSEISGRFSEMIRNSPENRLLKDI